jgi:hypothetical protein
VKATTIGIRALVDYFVLLKDHQQWHDKRIKIKQLKPGDKLLLFNSRVHLFGHGKLRSKWEDPYLVLHTVDHSACTL